MLERNMRQIRRVRDEIRRSLETAVLDGLEPTVNRAREILTENGHVVTGALRDSIAASSEQVDPDTVQGVVGSDRDYAEEIENLPDGGFLFRASEETTPEMVRLAGAELERAMKRGASR